MSDTSSFFVQSGCLYLNWAQAPGGQATLLMLIVDAMKMGTNEPWSLFQCHAMQMFVFLRFWMRMYGFKYICALCTALQIFRPQRWWGWHIILYRNGAKISVQHKVLPQCSGICNVTLMNILIGCIVTERQGGCIMM